MSRLLKRHHVHWTDIITFVATSAFEFLDKKNECLRREGNNK